MTQSEMLKLIARHGYNVGFGAKKNFATYDLICKASGWISFISLAVGVFALFIPELATNVISAILIIFGVATMYIQFYDSEKQSYESAGIEQTKIFNELEVIYRNVKAMQTLTISVHNNPSTLSCPGFTARSSANRSSEVTGTHIINFTVNLKKHGLKKS